MGHSTFCFSVWRHRGLTAMHRNSPMRTQPKRSGTRLLAGKITALEAQKKSKRRVNVYLDGAFAFGLADIVAAPLRVGQFLADHEIAVLRHRDAAERCYEMALRFLSYRPRSRAELARHLATRQVPKDLIAHTLERLADSGLLDDGAFAHFWVENRESFRPRSSAALRYELRRKGVDEDVIDDAVRGINEEDSAYQAAQTLAPRLAHVDRDTFRRRLGGYLRRRGYSYETARATVDRLWRERVPSNNAGGEHPSAGSRR